MDQHAIGAIILAAGGSIRYGSAKQLALVDGVPMLKRTVNNVLASDPRTVVVITGAIRTQIAALLEEDDVAFAHNPKWYEGMAGSITTGIKYLEKHQPDVDAAMVVLADQPFITGADFKSMHQAFNGKSIVATAYPDGPGVPAIFPQSVWPSMQHLTGDAGARDLLRSTSDIVTVTLGDTRDIDRPSQIR